MTRCHTSLLAVATLLFVGVGCDSGLPHNSQTTGEPELASLTIEGAGGGALQVTVRQLAPDLDVQGATFIWEADVQGIDEEECTFSWTVSEDGGYGLFLFEQQSFTADHVIDGSGPHTVSATADCGGQTGQGSRSFNVTESGNPQHRPPFYGSRVATTSSMPVSTAAPPGAGQDAPNYVCVVYHGYSYDYGYYRGYSDGCAGGGRTEPLAVVDGVEVGDRSWRNL